MSYLLFLKIYYLKVVLQFFLDDKTEHHSNLSAANPKTFFQFPKVMFVGMVVNWEKSRIFFGQCLSSIKFFLGRLDSRWLFFVRIKSASLIVVIKQIVIFSYNCQRSHSIEYIVYIVKGNCEYSPQILAKTFLHDHGRGWGMKKKRVNIKFYIPTQVTTTAEPH